MSVSVMAGLSGLNMAQLDTEAMVCVNVEDNEGNIIPFYYQSIWLDELMKPDIIYELE